MFGYRRRLKRDLDHWRERGWVDETHARAILQDVDGRGLGLGLAPILAILAAVLLSFAAMSFVAANWQDMSKLARLVLLFIGICGSYGVAWMFNERAMPFFSEAAILLGLGIFGASIMLIAQMYHMEGNPPDAVLTWAAGAGLATVLLNSKTALALAIGLFTLWSGWESALTRELHWIYLPVWGGLLALARRQDWRPALHLLTIALIIWLFTQMIYLNIDHQFELITTLGLGVIALAYLGEEWINRHTQFAHALFCYGMIIAFIGAFGWQFADKQSIGMLVLLAAMTLAAIVFVIFHGSRSGDHVVLWLGYAGFSIELLALYIKTLGTLLDTSLFFLLAGVIVAGLAYFAWRLHRAQLGEEEGKS